MHSYESPQWASHCGNARYQFRLRETGLDRPDAGDRGRDGNLGRERGGSSGVGGKPPDFLFELEQQGSTVKGVMRFPAGGTSQAVASASRISPGPIVGTVAGDVFRFRLTNGNLDGELTVSGDEMTGQVSWLGSRPVSLRRVDPPAPPASPPR
jgi:hypothetical protein